MTRMPSNSKLERGSTALAVVLLLMLLPVPRAVAQNSHLHDRELFGRWGFGLEAGIMKPVEGEWDYSTVDQFGGVHLSKAISGGWNLTLALQYGYVRPGAESRGQEVGFSSASGAPLYTEFLQPTLKVQHRFTPAALVSPKIGVGFGLTKWNVLHKFGEDVGWFPSGDPVDGYDVDGNRTTLEGSDFTLLFELGLDVVLTGSLYFDIGARYTVLTGNQKDNAGMSFFWGPDHVDANTGLASAYAGLTWWFGSADRDRDGIANVDDGCPDAPEDMDGYNDLDGCPDLDNDQDGILDAVDACPAQPEDHDGYQDEDGCPDPDNDQDGIADNRDQCPDEAEDVDGWEDLDGCPDPDNDQDGVPDELDQCPRTPADSKVDANGCVVNVPTAPTEAVFVPAPTSANVLEGVNFVTGSAELRPESIAVLVELAGTLKAEPELQIEIRGHTDSTGGARANQDLSRRRAESVRASLIQLGVAPDRLTAVGYGENAPIADNATAAGRARNRRVEVHRR